MVVNGLKTEKERADEGKKLLEWGFHDFQSRPSVRRRPEHREAKVYGGEKGHVPLVGAERGPADGAARRRARRIIARVVYTGPVPAPVQKGQQIGMLKVWRGDIMVLEVPLQAAEEVVAGSMPQRAFDAATELVIGLFRAGVQRL